MRVGGALKRGLAVAAVLASAGAAGVVLTLPPRARTIVRAAPPSSPSAMPPAAVVRGAYHVHTTRSDGSGSVDQVAAAAARAGLQFLLITDHGDGTRPRLAPSYRFGVLCIDGVEISTTGGHYIALDLPPTPHRLAGDARDVVEDVTRFGGFGVAAHPDSPKRELAWDGWDLPVDGLEWLNLDTEWRDESRWRILWGLLQHRLRPAETVASLIGHSPVVLERWDRLARTRRAVGLAAVDAHARFGVEGGAGGRDIAMLEVPSYETSFRTIRIHVELAQPLTGRADEDAAAIVASVRGGRTFSTIDALADPGRFDFWARSGPGASRTGGFLAPHGPITLAASVDAPAGARLHLVCDGVTVRDEPADRPLSHVIAQEGTAACRVEAGWREGDGFARWLVSNPIYLRSADVLPPPDRTVLRETDTLGDRVRGARWLAERDPGSQADVHAEGAGLAQTASLSYALRSGPRAGQYAALVTPDVEALARFTHLAFVLRADRPSRVSVQVREPLPSGEGRRWARSVHADATATEIALALSDFKPVPPTRDAHPPAGAIKSLLFVVDTVHTAPGASGTIQVARLHAGRP